MGYWNNRDKIAGDVPGPLDAQRRQVLASTRTGYYVYAGRSDDMLKVGGIYVSPIEVESALITHPAVLEAAVIGQRGRRASWSSRSPTSCSSAGHAPTPALAEELRQHVKSQLAPYKYPRWIEFIDELPKTATGKIQRFKLRAQAAILSATRAHPRPATASHRRRPS